MRRRKGERRHSTSIAISPLSSLSPSFPCRPLPALPSLPASIPLLSNTLSTHPAICQSADEHPLSLPIPSHFILPSPSVIWESTSIYILHTYILLIKSPTITNTHQKVKQSKVPPIPGSIRMHIRLNKQITTFTSSYFNRRAPSRSKPKLESSIPPSHDQPIPWHSLNSIDRPTGPTRVRTDRPKLSPHQVLHQVHDSSWIDHDDHESMHHPCKNRKGKKKKNNPPKLSPSSMLK